MSNRHIYKIQFLNQDKVYEVYARSVGSSDIMGFVEFAELVFGEKSSLLVDPAEESLKTEFAGVRRSYIPMHCVLRIDEVEKQGMATIRDSDPGSRVHPFPTLQGVPQKPDSEP